MAFPAVRSALFGALVFGLCEPAAAQDNGLVLYGAGSLREAMSEMAMVFTRERGVPVQAQFGASGRMRERIEAGERVDVFTSADTGHATKLVTDGRASVMALFARKRKPGSGRVLRERAVVLDNPPGSPPSPSGDYYLDALRDGRVALAIVYCSGKGRYAKLDSSLVMTTFPPDLTTGPEYGLAVMKDARPQGMLLALSILSPQGQKILAANGFKPVAAPDAR